MFGNAYFGETYFADHYFGPIEPNPVGGRGRKLTKKELEQSEQDSKFYEIFNRQKVVNESPKEIFTDSASISQDIATAQIIETEDLALILAIYEAYN